jgi:hypothetical protein
MYVCLCNGVSDKKIRQAVRQFHRSLFSNYANLFPLEINAVSVFVLRVRLWKMN